MASDKAYYGVVFNCFPNWDKYPNWDEIKTVLYSWKQGTELFKDADSDLTNKELILVLDENIVSSTNLA